MALRPAAASPLSPLLAERPVRERGGLEFEYSPDAKGLRVVARRNRVSATAVIEWIFGAGAQGMTPVGRAGARYFEHRISFYTASSSPGVTIGHPENRGLTPAAALGIVQPPHTIYRCFNCHAANVGESVGGPELANAQPGVTCERCHGPGRAHIDAARRADAAAIRRTVLNPRRFPAAQSVQICAECHRSPDSHSPAPEAADPASVRFQPIGLMASMCFKKSGTLSCLTCHDPHANAVRGAAAFYAQRCLGCHAASPVSRCARETNGDCVSCHMKTASPLKDLRFTDHRIRIYR